MRMSDEGRGLLTKREGVRLKAYKDSVGVWTIGIGHTSAAGLPNVTPDLVITAAQCDEIFSRDLKQYEDAVNNAVKIKLAQHQFDACVSLCFNIGTGGFARSTVARRINAGDMTGAADAFMLWSKPPEIIGRRKTEQVQFRSPYRGAPPPPDIAPVPIPATKPTSGNVAGTVAVIVATGSGAVVADQSSKRGASTSDIAIVIGLTLVIAIAAFFTIRHLFKKD